MSGRAKNYVTRTTCDDPANRDPNDFYPTPAVATRALLARERFTRSIWEPACGAGDMSRVLEAAGHAVRSTTLFDQGYGEVGVDFLTRTDRAENIVTNPPFKLAEEFTELALSLARRKVAMLYRLAWLEGIGRYRRFYDVDPPTRVYVFSRRIHFSRGGWAGGAADGKGGMTAFMWMVWDRSVRNAPTELRWFSPTEGDE